MSNDSQSVTEWSGGETSWSADSDSPDTSDSSANDTDDDDPISVSDASISDSDPTPDPSEESTDDNRDSGTEDSEDGGEDEDSRDWGNPEQMNESEPEIIDTGNGNDDEGADPGFDGQAQFESIDARDGRTPTEDPDEMMELGVIQVNYTTEPINEDIDEAIIHVFCREPGTNRPIHVRVHQFAPYFYVPPGEARQIDTSDDPRFLGKTGGFETIRGKEVTQVKTRIPRVVGNIRDEYDHYEADVLFPDRFLIDNEIQSGIRIPKKETNGGTIDVHVDDVEPADVSVDPRIHNLDIEVNDRNGFPEPEDAEEPVICITAHDSKDDQYTVWYLNDATVEGEIPETVDDYEFISDSNPDVDIRTFEGESRVEAEARLLDDYVKYVQATQADLLVGWNVDEFDAEYLINRMDYLDSHAKVDIELSSDRLSRINEVWGGGWRGPNVKGRVVFDLLEAYKRTQFTELDSYRLDAIGEQELGVGKERFDGDIGDLWESDPKRLIEYNLRDVEICVELDEQQSIIEFWDEVRQFVGCRIQDAPIPGDAVDMYVLHKVHDRFVLPSKGTVETGEEYEGGAVFDPMTGIEEMVTVLDLKSLYPMCMCTINASPETKVTDPESFDGETFHAPNGIHYRKDEDGIIRDMVNELLSEREQKKELRSQYDPDDPEYALYDRQQGAVKVIMNSLYGTLGWDRFRLYDKDNAAAVTATGRGVIDFTEQTVEDLGYEVTYGDTDSVMISLGDLSNVSPELDEELLEKGPDWETNQLQELQAALNKSFDIEDHINDAYNEYAREELNAEEHRFLIEFEKLYKRFLQAGKKKRYAGHIVWKEGKYVDDIDITGFEYKRSDIAGITKTAQKELIEQLVTGTELDEIRSYLHDLIDDFENGEFPLSEVGIPGGIGKALDDYETDTAHVRGAKYANLLLDMNLGQASKPKRVYLDRVHPDFYRYAEDELGLDPQRHDVYGDFKRDPDVICFIHDDQVPDDFEVDWEKMLDKTLQGPLSRVLKAVDITWNDVKAGQEQTGLENFM